jgi:hypothetical protein
MGLRAGGRSFGPRAILLIIAVILFVLAAIGVSISSIALEPLGLAAFAAAFLVGEF